MKERHLQNVIYYTALLVLMIFILTPVLYMLAIGFSENPDFSGNTLLFTLQHFRDVLTTPSLHFPAYLKNSIIVSGASAVAVTTIAGLGAYAVTRFHFRGKSFLLLAILALSMFPQISITGYLFRLMAGVGLINTHTGLILPYTAWVLPLSFWILISYFSQIPLDLDKAAFVDGASLLRTFWSIVLPLASPGLFSTFLLSFIFSFNEFLFALMLTTDYTARTVPVGISLFQGLHGEIPWGEIMAAAVITTAPVILLTLVFQRFIIQGLTRGAIKG